MRVPSSFALALWAVVMAASQVQSKQLPQNTFQDPPSLRTDSAHRRFSSGRAVDSPFGNGCVGTDNLCAVSLSVAEQTERATLRRSMHPELWQVREDIQWEQMLADAKPGTRLEKFFGRLGGEAEWARKLGWTQEELRRRLKKQEAHAAEERQALRDLHTLLTKAAEEELRKELGWKAHLYPVNSHLTPARWEADRGDDHHHSDSKTHYSKAHGAEQRETEESWHKELRERFTKPFDYESISSNGSPNLVVAPWSWTSGSSAARSTASASDKQRNATSSSSSAQSLGPEGKHGSNEYMRPKNAVYSNQGSYWRRRSQPSRMGRDDDN